jgi:hypothetical protein
MFQRRRRSVKVASILLLNLVAAAYAASRSSLCALFLAFGAYTV